MGKVLVLLLSLSGAALAASPVEHQAAEAAQDQSRTVAGGASLGVKACHEDIEKWCADVKPGQGRLGACLLEHSKQLSPKCLRWSEHGGKAHRSEAFREIDKAATPAPSRP